MKRHLKVAIVAAVICLLNAAFSWASPGVGRVDSCSGSCSDPSTCGWGCYCAPSPFGWHCDTAE